MSTLNTSELRDVRTRHRLEGMVETGCFQGDSIGAALAAGFGRVLSCDLSSRAVRCCRERFKGSQVDLFEMDSISFLKSMLPSLTGRHLFWLDAHYPAFYDLPETSDDRFPLKAELDLIVELKVGFEHDVIAFDDVRVLRDPANPRWRPGEVSDYFAIDSVTLHQLTERFRDTHSFSIDHREEGIGYLLPLGDSCA